MEFVSADLDPVQYRILVVSTTTIRKAWSNDAMARQYVGESGAPWSPCYVLLRERAGIEEGCKEE